jgi:lambda repressor-like predicted transcriptional regulator
MVERGMFQILIPNLTSVEWGIVPIALSCGLLLFWRQWDSWRIIAIAAALGVGLHEIWPA